jgi:hypothetical protein
VLIINQQRAGWLRGGRRTKRKRNEFITAATIDEGMQRVSQWQRKAIYNARVWLMCVGWHCDMPEAL